jgi:hypothetical protein
MSMWPTALRLDIIEAGMSCLGFQALVHKNKAPVVRVQCQPGMDNHDFGELVKTLRKSKCVGRHDSGQSLSLTHWQVAVASARWETESQDKGSQELGLVLAPLSSGLFCAILPASELPRAVLRHPQQAKQETKVPADCSPPTDIPRENVELLQGEDPCSHQTNDFTAASADALVQLISQQQQQAYVQAQLQQLQAQNIEQRASLDAQLALGDELTGITCGNEPIVATENCAGADFGLIGPHLEQWYHDENLFTSYTQL